MFFFWKNIRIFLYKLIIFLHYEISFVQYFLFGQDYSSPKNVVLPIPEWWGELFELCPTFTTWNFSFSRTKAAYKI